MNEMKWMDGWMDGVEGRMVWRGGWGRRGMKDPDRRNGERGTRCAKPDS